jgi:inner membrane protein
VVTLSACSHLVGDVVTPMGLRPFAPVSDVHLTLSLVYSRNPQVNAALLFAGGTATAAYWMHGTAVGRRASVRATSPLRSVATGRALVRWMVSVVAAGRQR